MLYAENPEWKDVVPVAQYDEGLNPVAPILYAAEYKDAMDYFRAIVKSGEKSTRVLKLTEHIIAMNPSHYSVWQYRWDTLLATSSSLKDELLLMDAVATTHMKTYQVWHYRRLLVTKLETPIPELAFIESVLDEDSKNYHTWSYRQWLLAHFNDEDMWAGELPYTERMISEDVRNNSAWHHRFFVVWASGIRRGEENREDILRRELAFTKTKIALAPNNDSAWNYLRGILKHTRTPFSHLREFVVPYMHYQSVATSSAEIDLDNPKPGDQACLPCPAALEFLAEIDEDTKNVDNAILLYKQLGGQYDTIRKAYWDHRAREASASKVTIGA